MTEEEAIKMLRYRIDTASEIAGKGEDGNAFEDMELAIKALENMQKLEENKTYLLYREYLSLGTVEELRALKEKQIPKKPFVDTGNFLKCSHCHSVVKNTDKYCHECGQKLDSEVQE